jgi:SAM-dependent methyltransferase
MTPAKQDHWEHIYESKAENELSWFQERPVVSLDLIRATGAKPSAAIIDIGGGASRLVDALLDEGFHASVLDISEKALAAAKARLGPRATKVAWIAADVTAWEPSETYDLWHDRAAFHFLTEAADQRAYAERVARAVRPGGHAVIGTFAPDGPERCSGLPVMRHDAASIVSVLGDKFALVETRRDDHVTRRAPRNIQPFPARCLNLMAPGSTCHAADNSLQGGRDFGLATGYLVRFAHEPHLPRRRTSCHRIVSTTFLARRGSSRRRSSECSATQPSVGAKSGRTQCRKIALPRFLRRGLML